MRFQHFPGTYYRELTKICYAGIQSAVGQEGVVSIWCSTGEFLLDFPKVIITAVGCLAPFTDC